MTIKKRTTTRPKGSGSLLIEQTPDLMPYGLVMHGKAGIGKTSLAAELRRPNTKTLFVRDNKEKGIDRLIRTGRIPQGHVGMVKKKFSSGPGAFDQLCETCIDIAAKVDPKVYSVVAFDTAGGFEKFAATKCCAEEFKNVWGKDGFGGYAAGADAVAKRYWPQFLDCLETIKEAGMNVILICHSHIKAFNNPEGADYDRWEPFLDKRAWKLTDGWADNVLFLNYAVTATKDTKRGTKYKAEDYERVICTQWCPAYDAKSRDGMPTTMPFTSPEETGKALRKYLHPVAPKA